MIEKPAAVLSSASLLWTSMNSWLTPTVLFLILNLVIATILFTSNRRTTTTTHGDGPPSVLQRLKSFNFQTHLRSTPDSETHDFFQDSTGSAEATVTGGDLSRTRSDTEPASASASVPAKMRKSASLKYVFGHFKEDDDVEARRPATTREIGRVGEVDEEVDAKADDFINRFKQQLRLQRLDSIINRRKTNDVK